MSKIKIVEFCNQDDDIEFDMLDASFVRYMGGLEVIDTRVDYFTISDEKFTINDANNIIIQHLEKLMTIDEKCTLDDITKINTPQIKEFIKQLKAEITQ